MLTGLLFIAMALNPDVAPSPVPPSSRAVENAPVQAGDELEIKGLLAQQYTAWNARDIEGYMVAFWRSPLLLYGVQSSVWTGWEDVRSHLNRDYPDKNAMGNVALDRLKTTLLDKDTATTVEWWTDSFPRTKVRGFTISTWRKLPEGWRIIQGSTSATETP
ncbi:MAG TPA: hypothetical protein VGD78_20015 [Chthoniobacterales bacterium]